MVLKPKLAIQRRSEISRIPSRFRDIVWIIYGKGHPWTGDDLENNISMFSDAWDTFPSDVSPAEVTLPSVTIQASGMGPPAAVTSHMEMAMGDELRELCKLEGVGQQLLEWKGQSEQGRERSEI